MSELVFRRPMQDEISKLKQRIAELEGERSKRPRGCYERYCCGVCGHVITNVEKDVVRCPSKSCGQFDKPCRIDDTFIVEVSIARATSNDVAGAMQALDQ